MKRKIQYRLDAEPRKLRELESRGGPELSVFERSEDTTKGPPRRSNARGVYDEASNRFRAIPIARWRQASIPSE